MPLGVLRHETGERCCQVIAQRKPLLVVILEGKDPCIGPVLVGQEFAERVGIFHERLFHRLEAIGLIDLLDGRQHGPHAADLVGINIPEALGDARLRADWLLLAHGRGS